MYNDKIIGLLEKSFDEYKDKKAVIFKDTIHTYGELKEAIQGLSKMLSELNLLGQYPIGLFLKNCPEFIIGYYGLIYQEIVTMLVDHSLKRDELEAIVKDCHLGGFLVHAGEKDTFPLKMEFQNVLEYKNFVLYYNNKLEYNRPFEPEKLTGIVSCRFSSGTTGVPKCMMYAQENIIAAASNWRNTVHLNEADKVLCVANYTHGLAFNTAMLSPLMSGAQIHMMESLMPRQIGKYIENQKITKFVAFPVLYQLMSEERLKDKFNLSSVRICVSSGTVLHTEVKQKFKENVGIYISDLYGVAETGLCILNQTDNVETVGKALQGVEISIKDDDGRDLDVNEQGQIAIKSGAMSRGYYNFPGLFEERVTEDGFYLSGDIAVMDEEGYVFVKGRKQDFIDVAGKKADPKEIEEVLLKHDKIADAAVFGNKSSKTGLEVLCAAIVAEKLSREDIIIFLQDKLSAYKIPQRIYFIDRLPRNSSGKVLRRELKDVFKDE